MKVLTDIFHHELEQSKWILQLTIDFYMDNIRLKWVNPLKAGKILKLRKRFYNVIKLSACPCARYLAYDFMSREFEAFKVKELYRDLLKRIAEGDIYCALSISDDKTHEYIIFE